MCHHYRGARQPPAHLADEFSLRSNLYQLSIPELGYYPLDLVPIVRQAADGEREMVAAEWGFLPGWWKPSDATPNRRAFQRKTINARSEEVDQKPTYRESFRRRRCLLPAEEFFERGFYFHLDGRRPFAFAGLWDRWLGDGGTAVETCTLLTTLPNEAVAAVGHPRMPVILTSRHQYEQWLDADVLERGRLEDLMKPTPSEIWHKYQAEPVAKRRAESVVKKGKPPDSAQGLLFD
jgi:putative SOS response-associated peptidase YedK